MTYTVTRDGRNLGTYSEEGINRQLDNGVLLPGDLVFLENQQKSVTISELQAALSAPTHEVTQFVRQVQEATPTAYVTPALIAINILVFIVMLLAGVSPFQPTNTDLTRWGADFGPLTIHGQWWRLLTAAFLHAGIIHIAFNMWALFSGGVFTERLFGNGGFLALYLLAAIGGDLASIWSHPLIISVGASGAIFGVFGALFAFIGIRHKSIPAVAAASLLKNAGIFVAGNLIYGISDSHVDMAAHLGGLATGFIAGCALAWTGKADSFNPEAHRTVVVVLAALLLFLPIAAKVNTGSPQQADALSTQLTGKKLTVGDKDLIFYSGTVTELDARRLADALTPYGFFRNRGTLVLYSRSPAGAIVSLHVKEGAWNDPRIASTFRLLGSLVSMTAGRPLKLRLIDDRSETKKEFAF